MAGCSSVPDALNPVEWYEGASDAVGGVFAGDEAEAGRSAGDPGSSEETAYPNLGTVPARPMPSTTAEQREALKQGLIADRANARYTEPAPSAATSPGSAASAAPTRAVPTQAAPAARPAPASTSTPPPRRSQPQAPQSSVVEPQPSAPAAVAPAAPPAAVPPAAVPPAATASAATTAAAPAAVAPVAAAPAAASGPGERSNLWPNRPAPETPGVQASTTGQVGGDEIHRDAATRNQTPVPEHARTETPAPAARAVASGQLAERTTLDSAGSGSAAATPAPSQRAPAAPSEPPRPRVSEQSVIVNEDAIAGLPAAAPPAGLPAGRRYLASTIYFGHGSANLTGAERQEIADIARAAAANGAAVQVIGHASARTADMTLRDHETANLAMSMQRARVVAEALIRAGMPSERVIVEARGDEQPEFYEVMPSGEAGNRRTEIIVIY